jgi:hypothetical protein
MSWNKQQRCEDDDGLCAVEFGGDVFNVFAYSETATTQRRKKIEKKCTKKEK